MNKLKRTIKFLFSHLFLILNIINLVYLYRGAPFTGSRLLNWTLVILVPYGFFILLVEVFSDTRIVFSKSESSSLIILKSIYIFSVLICAGYIMVGKMAKLGDKSQLFFNIIDKYFLLYLLFIIGITVSDILQFLKAQKTLKDNSLLTKRHVYFLLAFISFIYFLVSFLVNNAFISHIAAKAMIICQAIPFMVICMMGFAVFFVRFLYKESN